MASSYENNRLPEMEFCNRKEHVRSENLKKITIFMKRIDKVSTADR